MRLNPRETLGAAARARVVETYQAVGERRALDILGVSRATLARLMGGLTVQRGTIALVTQRLSRLPSGDADDEVTRSLVPARRGAAR